MNALRLADPVGVGGTGFPVRGEEPRLSFSLIVPARHEEAVLAATLERMMGIDHPDYEVLVVVGHDDPGTTKWPCAAPSPGPAASASWWTTASPRTRPRP